MLKTTKFVKKSATAAFSESKGYRLPILHAKFVEKVGAGCSMPGPYLAALHMLAAGTSAGSPWSDSSGSGSTLSGSDSSGSDSTSETTITTRATATAHDGIFAASIRATILAGGDQVRV